MRRSLVLIASTALAAGLLAGPAQAATGGAESLVGVFPSNELTVPDRGQSTNLRVDLPLPDCTVQVTDCNTVRLLNQLDGFDLDPRIALTFDEAVDPVAVAAGARVQTARGRWSTGLDRVVYDAATFTVYAHPVDQLVPGTEHQVVLAGERTPSATFTTLSATDGLSDMIDQLRRGLAHRDAGIGLRERDLQVDAVFPAVGTTLAYTQDLGSSLNTVGVPNVSGTAAGSYVFGSYLAPSWLTADRDIPQTPTRDSGPVVTGAERIPFVAIIPAGPVPNLGWPVTVFGHGFTRSDGDVFLAASQNATRGLSTLATDVVGHGFGPRSTWQVTRNGQTTTVDAHGRGIDLDGNGTITSTEGSATQPQPAALAQVNSRDGLRQTVADNSALVLALSQRLPSSLPLSRLGATYYGQSFGGIYGTMLAGTDRGIEAFGLNVPGGPITEIARLSPAFRPLTTQALAGAVPPLLNGGNAGFTESMPLAGGAAVLTPAPGALGIQQFLAEGTWLTRSGSPETFAPLVPTDRTLVQVAFGDQTVPNPTSGTLVRAGNLEGRTTFYRNDRTLNAGTNPHGFLLNPTFGAGFAGGQTQMSTFLASGGRTIIDPDGAATVFEVPIADPDLLRALNF